jgi:heme exporter protein B
MSVLRDALLLAGKDLRVEARTRSAVGLVCVLGLSIVVVLALGLGPGSGAGTGAGSTRAVAVLWAAYLFAGVLCFERTMGIERQDDALAGLLLTPMDRSAIFFGKLLANLAMLLGMALVITPVGVVLLRLDLSAAPIAFVGIMGLGLLGFACIGTLFSAAASAGRPQSGLLAMLVLPLSLPIVLTSTHLVLRRCGTPGEIGGGGGGVEGAGGGTGVGVLVAFDLIFLVAGWLVYELLLE